MGLSSIQAKHNMIKPEDVVTVTVPDEYIDTIKDNAKKAAIGGRSHVRGSQDRKNNLIMDQIAGQLGEIAGSLFFTGSADGYISARDRRNRSPHRGDDGEDIDGVRCTDIKTSVMRYWPDPLRYRLMVRDDARRPNWIYVLALIKEDDALNVSLVGWAKESDLPKTPYHGDKASLVGAYIIMADKLRP